MAKSGALLVRRPTPLGRKWPQALESGHEHISNTNTTHTKRPHQAHPCRRSKRVPRYPRGQRLQHPLHALPPGARPSHHYQLLTLTAGAGSNSNTRTHKSPHPVPAPSSLSFPVLRIILISRALLCATGIHRHPRKPPVHRSPTHPGPRRAHLPLHGTQRTQPRVSAELG